MIILKCSLRRIMIFSNKMTQPAILIVSFKEWDLLVKTALTVSLRWEDFVVFGITKEPDRADESLEDLNC